MSPTSPPVEFEGWPRVGGGAVILKGGAILLQRRLTAPEAGAWGIPGGKVDPFEPVMDAVRREVEEETGLRLGGLELLSVCDMIDRDAGYHWVAPAYLAMSFEGEPELREPAKHSSLEWFALTALPAPLTAPTKAALEALAQRKGPGANRGPDRSSSPLATPRGRGPRRG